MPFLFFLEQFFSWAVCALVVFNGFLLVVNLAFWFRNRTAPTQSKERGRKLIAVIGSGGHTMEMLKILAAQDALFPYRTYIIAESDKLSGAKVDEFEQSHGNKYSVKYIPRAREVGQSFLSSVGSTTAALFRSFALVYQERSDVVLSNGPAIGLGICLFARFCDKVRFQRCRVIFVESICRVQKLSLTGRLIYHLRIADVFIVQWKDLQKKYPRTEFIGRIV